MAWVLGTLAASGALAVTATALAEARGTIVLLSCIASACALPLIVRLAQRRFDPFEPIVWFSLAWLAVFVIHTGAMIRNNDFALQTVFQSVNLADSFQWMLVQGLIGMVGFLVGYSLPFGSAFANRWRPAARDVSIEVFVPIVLGFALLGIVLFFIYTRVTGVGLAELVGGRSQTLFLDFGGPTSYLTQGVYLLIPASVMLITVGRRVGNGSVTALGWLLFAALVLRGLAWGDRLLLLPVSGALLMTPYLRRDRRPSLAGCVTALVIGLILIRVVGDIRTADARSRAGVGAIAVRVATDPAEWFSTITHGWDGAEARTVALLLTRPVEYQFGGATLGDILTRPVPRALWHNKPLPPSEQVISEELPLEYRTKNANLATTPLFLFYMDGGPVGVFIGMLVYGVLARSVYAYYQRYRHALFAQLLLALTAPLMVLAVRDNSTDTLIRGTLILLPLVLAFWLAGRRTRAASKPTSRVA